MTLFTLPIRVTRSVRVDDAYEAWRVARDAFRSDPSYETGADLDAATDALRDAENDSFTRGFNRGFDHTH